MDIASAMSSARNVGAATAEERTSIEKEGFLKLLIAQLSNQDPMQPQDSEKYVQQFTQFSNLEQLMNLNKGVDQLSIGQLSNNTQEAIRFVGRTVVAKGDSLHWDESGIAPVKYSVPQDAESAVATIYDATGEVVRTVPVNSKAGLHQFQWDGTDEDGRMLEPGEYSVNVQAIDAEENEVPIDTYVRGQVDGIRFDNGYPELLVGGRRLRMSDITEVH
ncbi:MAG: FlgD immunoglobulin-like domain containing protein [Myxococcota bacterium]|nr:FlgD immunoglobulin-like domain containing protein [Myxococcota bacterium]